MAQERTIKATSAETARPVVAVAGLLALGLLPLLGRFLPPTLAWGFDHLAFLPAFATALAAAGWLALLVTPLRRAGSRITGAVSTWLLAGPWWAPVSAALRAGGLFRLLRTPTHLLGDGVLIGEMVARGTPFRVLDGMDYLLLRLALDALRGRGVTSFELNAWSAALAGALAVLTALLLLRRSRLPLPGRALAFLLWLLSAASLLYCGYVESYGLLSVAMLGFTWSGALAERGEVPPLVPGLCFGFAIFFHSLGLLAVPGLAWLLLRPPDGAASPRRWRVALLVPAVLLPLAAVAIHVAAGFDAAWFRQEVLEGRNQRSLLVALTGAHGLLSLEHARDLANWLLLAVPVSLWLAVAGARGLARRRGEPGVGFLLVHVAGVLLAFLLLDRKLGVARDWDIFAPQVAAPALLAALAWAGRLEAPAARPRGLPSVSEAAPWVALLLLWPWLAVNASREASLRRFDAVLASFPPVQRAYALEDLAKYHRDRGDAARALAYYEASVRANPRNERTRVQLGAAYAKLGRFDDAERQLVEALRLDPGDGVAFDMRAKVAFNRQDFATALGLSRRATALLPEDADAWSTRGLAAFQADSFPEARQALLRSATLRAEVRTWYYLGLSCAALERWDEAVGALQRAVGSAEPDNRLRLGLAAALEAREAARSARTGRLDRAALVSARALAARSAEVAPGDSVAATYLRHLDDVLWGRVPPRNTLRR